MKLPVHIRQSQPEGAVQVYCPDLPGCSAAAPTLELALERLRARIVDHFAASARRAPAGTRIAILEV